MVTAAYKRYRNLVAISLLFGAVTSGILVFGNIENGHWHWMFGSLSGYLVGYFFARMRAAQG